MTNRDLLLERFYSEMASRPPRKHEDTITSFNRDIFWYNRDEVNRQADATTTQRITYEDHRKAIEIAINMMGKTTSHDIAMCILTNRYFSSYRNSVFAGEGSFTTDYTYVIKRIGMVFNDSTGRMTPSSITTKLKEYTTPTLVQINHISGTVTEVITPGNLFTLNEWAIKFNENAPESTSYRATLSIV